VRKGLSQIIYLIIAASVLMMIAMVITFTDTGNMPAEDELEISESDAIQVAEDYTWKQCSVDRVWEHDGEIWLDCCDTYVAGNLTYRACEDITVSQNESTGQFEVRP
jgi:hypothetical protein